MNTWHRLFICFVFLALSACGGGGPQAPEPEPPPEEPPVFRTFTVDLQWDPPLEYEDGTPIEYLKEYRVYYGEDPNYLKQSKVLVIPGGSIEFASVYVTVGVWHFAVTAVSDSDVESDLSNIVTYTFSEPIQQVQFASPFGR